jgi:hypothetical protein
MEKNITFTSAFVDALKRLGPFMFIGAVALASILSEGSWSKFFDKMLPHAMAAMAIAWVFLALRAAHYRVQGRVGGSDGGSTEDYYVPDVTNINPQTGTPMIGNSGFDASGVPFGHPRDD